MSEAAAIRRRRILQNHIPAHELWVIAHPSHVRYLTGFVSLVERERESILFLTRHRALLCHAYFSPAPDVLGLELARGCRPRQLTDHLQQWLKNVFPAGKGTPILVRQEEDELVISEANAIQTSIKHFGWKTAALDTALLWQERQIKDDHELRLLTDACELTAACLATVRQQLVPGVTELELQQLLDSECIRRGASGMAFPTIVAFGPHTAHPHHQPTHKPLAKETPILIDCGATYDGYCADMTRSWWFGTQPSSEYQTVTAAVTTAYQNALQTLRGGNTPSAHDVDSAARDYLNQLGYGPNFIHTTGHGVGLDIHEQPSIGQGSPHQLSPGMVITIEPGVYFPDKWGIRHENTVVITERGSQELTTSAD